jgi:hypothetical protein
VTFAGSRFLAVGESAGDLMVFASPDGGTWTELENDLSVGGDCALLSLVGAADKVLLVGDCSAGTWVSSAPAS